MEALLINLAMKISKSVGVSTQPRLIPELTSFQHFQYQYRGLLLVQVFFFFVPLMIRSDTRCTKLNAMQHTACGKWQTLSQDPLRTLYNPIICIVTSYLFDVYCRSIGGGIIINLRNTDDALLGARYFTGPV